MHNEHAHLTSSGIYEIVNLVNGKRYVGSAVNLWRRFQKHRSHLVRGTHHSRILQNAWNAHGADAFTFRALLVCGRDVLIAYEQAAIDALFPAYNVLPRAGSAIGRKMTAEHKAKIGAANRGRKVIITAETRAKISAALKGRPHGPMPEERREKVSAGRRGKCTGLRDPAIGERISAALRGRKLSDQHRQKISEVQRGRKQTPEHIAKAAAARSGRKRGPYKKRQTTQEVRRAQ